MPAVAQHPLSNRNAIVTGVSRRAGIGYAIARRLGEAGASLFVQSWATHDAAQPWGADAGGIDAVLAGLRASAPSVHHLALDFADADAPAQVIASARSALGHVDILVVNHARSSVGRLAELEAAEIDACLHVNVRATLLLAKEFAAQHCGQPSGRVVLLTSGQHLAPMPREVAYAVSKGAVHQATKTLADELIGRGITVNAVNPGPTDTGWGIGSPDATMPLGRFGNPDDAARLVTWLCTDDARWITGQIVDSEGGFRRWQPADTRDTSPRT